MCRLCAFYLFFFMCLCCDTNSFVVWREHLTHRRATCASAVVSFWCLWCDVNTCMHRRATYAFAVVALCLWASMSHCPCGFALCRHKPFGVTAIFWCGLRDAFNWHFKDESLLLYLISSDAPLYSWDRWSHACQHFFIFCFFLCVLDVVLYIFSWVLLIYLCDAFAVLLVCSIVPCLAVSRIFYGVWMVHSSILHSLSCWICLPNVIFLWWNLYPLMYQWLRSFICFYVFGLH